MLGHAQVNAQTITYQNNNPTTSIVPYGGSWTYSVSWTASGLSGFLRYIDFYKNSSSYISYPDYPTNGTFQYPISGVSSADEGYYYIRYYAYPLGYSPSVYLYVSPAILTQPVETTVLNGVATSMGIAAGPSTATFKWIDAATGTVLGTVASFAATTSMDGKRIYCRVSNSYGSVNSTSALIHVGTAPSITAQPPSVTVSAGQNATFAITASGSSPMTYAWYKGGSAILGASLPNLSLDSVTPTNAGTYACVVSNGYGRATSANATLVVTNTFPVIQTQPANQGAILGQSATFSLVAAGATPLYYAWYKNGVAIPAANLRYYTIPAAADTDAASYTCIISNVYSSATSATATLSIGTYPVIVEHPKSLVVTQGQDASFTVAATGMSLNYLWLKNGAPIAKATNATLLLTNVVFTNQANYTVAVTNLLGGVTSAVAVLTVQAPPSILAQPQGKSLGAGSNYNFSVTATGSAPLGYQWVKDGAPLAGAVASSNQVINAQATDAGGYAVIITNLYGSVTSSVANLAILYYPPVITKQPTDQNTVAGSNVTMSVVANGSTLSYQWYKAQTNGAAATAQVINGFVLGANITAGGGGYLIAPIVQILGGGGSGATAVAVVSNGVVVAVNVTTTGAGYTTAPEVAIGLPYDPAAGQSGPLLYLTNVATSDAGTYFAVVTNVSGSATTINALLTVNVPVYLTSQPQDLTLPPGAPATFSVSAVGTSPFSYQWYGRTATRTTATATALVLNGFVYGATITSGGAGYATAPGVQILGGGGTGAAASSVLSNDTVVDIVVSNPGAGYTSTPTIQIDPPPYLLLSGQTNSIFSISEVTANDAGSYFVVVANPYGSVVSTQATLTVGAGVAPVITAQPINGAVLLGAPFSFSVTADGTWQLAYQWYKDGLSLPAATLPACSITSAITNDTGAYFVIVSNAYGCATSSIASLIVGLPPGQLNCSMVAGRGVQIQMNGTPNFPYVLQSATNLTPPVHWQSVVTNLADNVGSWVLIRSNYSSLPAVFFRGSEP